MRPAYVQLHVNAPGHERERRNLQYRVRSLVVSFEVMAGDEVEDDRLNIAALKLQLAFHRRALREARQLKHMLDKVNMLHSVRIIQRTFRKLKEVILRDVLNWLTTMVVVLAVQDSASANAARRLQRMLRARIKARAAMREAARLTRANMLLKRSVKTNLGGNDVIRSVPWSTFAKIKATHPTDDKGGLSLYGGPPRLRTPRRPRTRQPAGASRTTDVPRTPRPPPDADVFQELDVHLQLLSESSYMPGCLSASGAATSGAASGGSQAEDLESSGYYARSSLLDGTSLCGCGSHYNGSALPSGSHYGSALPGSSISLRQARRISLVKDTSWGAGPRATEPYDHGGSWPHRGQPSARALAEQEADEADAKARGRKLRLAPLEVVMSLYHEGASSSYKDDPALYDETYLDAESYFGVDDALLAAKTGDPNASPMIPIPPTAAALPQLVSHHPATRQEELTAMYSLSPHQRLPRGSRVQGPGSSGLTLLASSCLASARGASSIIHPQPPPDGRGRGRAADERRKARERQLRAQVDGSVSAPRRAASARAWLGSTVSTEGSSESTAVTSELPSEVLRSACGHELSAIGYQELIAGYAGVSQYGHMYPGAGDMVHGFPASYYHHYTHILPPSNQRRAISARPRSIRTRHNGANPPVAGTATAARSYSQMRDRPSKPIRYRTMDYHGAGGGGSIDRHTFPGRRTR